MKTVLEYLEHTAALRPQAVAVEDASGTATFRELELACRKVGSALTAYAADQTDGNWDGVVTAFVDGWATEAAASKA